MVETYQLTPDLKRAYELMEMPAGVVFLTGKAGTGKSSLLRYFIQNTKMKKVITGTTGISALNIGGQTLHSFLKIRPPFELMDIKATENKNRKKLLKEMECLVIDEVSMLNPRLLDALDATLRVNRGSKQAFGGVKIILVGDLLQLPPVLSDFEQSVLQQDGYRTPYFFSAKSLMGKPFEVVVLKDIFRQSDPEFINVLSNVRRGFYQESDLDMLNRQVDPYFEPSEDELYLTLTTTNAIAKAVNEHRLSLINGKTHQFKCEMEGTFPKEMYPTDEVITLKEGAQVMFIRNDIIGGEWVNGTLGKIIEFFPEYDEEEYGERSPPVLKVEILQEGKPRTVLVSYETWENFEIEVINNVFKHKVIGKFVQIPVRLAWAVTIHKSQGQTFDKVIIDMGRGAFTTGQTYVALSRCRTLEGIVLRRPIQPSDIRADERVINFIRDYSKRDYSKQ
jgi:ATP-dependent exoDNAse (exonuclease V) alpha subunit